MKEIKLDFSTCIEEIIEMAEYLKSLIDPKDENNIGEIIRALPEWHRKDIIFTITNIQDNLKYIAKDLIRELLKAKNILNYEDENCDFEYLQDIPELIIEEGEDGYEEMLKECKIKHKELTTIKAVIKE